MLTIIQAGFLDTWNVKAQISEELDVLRGRQAVAAALSAFQLFLFILYIVVQIVVYTVKKCKKHCKRQVEEEVELVESHLMQRKTARRAAAARKAQETE